MRTHRLLVIGASLALGSVAAAQNPGPPPTEIQGTTVGEQVRRDLDALIQPGGSVDANALPPARAQGHIWTRSYATPIAGLCRRDEVIILYAGPVAYEAGAAANAVQPFGVTAQAWFRVLSDLDPLAAGYSGRPLDGACAATGNSETRGWFAAPDAYVAAEGYRAFVAAMRQINTPAHGIAGCREDVRSQQTCRDVLRGPGRIVRIDHCDTTQRGCLAIAFGAGEAAGPEQADGVILRLRYNRRGEPRIDAVEIQWPTISI
jgi:hypothetical protein